MREGGGQMGAVGGLQSYAMSFKSVQQLTCTQSISLICIFVVLGKSYQCTSVADVLSMRCVK